MRSKVHNNVGYRGYLHPHKFYISDENEYKTEQSLPEGTGRERIQYIVQIAFMSTQTGCYTVRTLSRPCEVQMFTHAEFESIVLMWSFQCVWMRTVGSMNVCAYVHECGRVRVHVCTRS